MMNRAVIALGANINPRANTEAALERIAEAFTLLKKSRLVFTEPVGYKNQPDFLNGAVLVEARSGKLEIIAVLKQIEADLGRSRNGRSDGPRNIDLDLLIYNGQLIDDDVYERDFLRQSIREVLPDFTFKT